MNSTESGIIEYVLNIQQSFPEVDAGIVSLEELLQSRSYTAELKPHDLATRKGKSEKTQWPDDAKSLLVIALKHPGSRPELDWWHKGNTDGNRELIKIARLVSRDIREKFTIDPLPLPYHVERGGVFLKDAAVLAGLGVIGRDNLFIHKLWGPRVRLKAILIQEEIAPFNPLRDFDPCATCGAPCLKSCPQDAFENGEYQISKCMIQMDKDIENSGDPDVQVVKYCRACELSCPVGRD
jgi:epoxyqueuosine reductase